MFYESISAGMGESWSLLAFFGHTVTIVDARCTDGTSGAVVGVVIDTKF